MQTEPGGMDLSAPGDVRVRRALLSVSDKRGLVDFARGLAALGVEIVSTGGTALELANEGIETRSVEDYTRFPEILDGRVKTLNPRIYAGLLAVRSDQGHVDTLNDHEIEPIDLVCVNLYPFERISSQRGVEDREVIENVDIGGPTLIRAAAKNHPFTAVVVSPESYDAVLEELRENEGKLSGRTRESLALEAFALTARYDAAISRWFAEREEDFPAQYTRSYEKVLDLPYGENPHQRAAYYSEIGARTHLLSMVSKLHGRELTFNNLLDLDAGRHLIDEFELPVAVIVKHNNPCGVGIAANAEEAFDKALATDPQSAYGGIYCFNRSIDRSLAEKLHAQFAEAILATGYDEDALEVLEQKPNVRLLENQERRRVPVTEHDAKRVRGGMLVQDRDTGLEEREAMDVVTRRKPTEDEWGQLLFAMRVCKHVRSNAVVLATELGTAGIGAGQMSRVDSVRLAIDKAGAASIDLGRAVLASDAFFPFADGAQLAIDAGVQAIIQPGGSQRDDEVIEACDNAGVAMVFTARRHFRH
ncbi:MAG: phosphoribosylaminoimidazolecarboxamide formyltransferase / cyclohydrolase [Thermoleophilaceae bacterium]|jgi:phosphoribosylaminoimidazolecarboxamide formyltransferase/IMP cyclohydrolase|nr:phosphoribosylaminoimidazolecarboxamide formyltransferase / cyclohydrolase [Thermoleophilaceae bacterium]